MNALLICNCLLNLASPGAWSSIFLFMNFRIQDATRPRFGRSSLKASLHSLSGVARIEAVVAFVMYVKCSSKSFFFGEVRNVRRSGLNIPKCN